MVAIHSRLGRRVANVFAGAAIGAFGIVLVLLIARALVPPNYSVSVMFFGDKSIRTPEQHRRAMKAQLSHPGFLQDVVTAANVPSDTASELARTLMVRPALASPTFTQMVALGHDPVALEQAANALAYALVDARAQHASRRKNARLSIIEQRATELARQRAEAMEALADARLPNWAKTGTLVLGALDARRFGIELDIELKLVSESSAAGARDDIDQTIAELELQMGGPGNVDARVFEAARLMASLDERQSHLLRARQGVREAFAPEHNLHVINRALVAKLKPPLKRTLWAAVLGAALGALFVFVRDMGRPARTRHRTGPALESHLHVAVVGSMAGALADYGERKLRPLAQTHPAHLAIDGVRSLHTALEIMARKHERNGPVIFANADDANNAGHVLSNLAILAADRGERVLIIETGRKNSVLAELFTTGTRTTLSTTLGAEDTLGEGKLPSASGRIRFMVADDDNASEPPVPGAFIGYFRRIFIRAHSIERATQLMRIYDQSIGILIGADSLSIGQWQVARDRWRDASVPLDGLVHCGHKIDERAYQAVNSV